MKRDGKRLLVVFLIPGSNDAFGNGSVPEFIGESGTLDKGKWSARLCGDYVL